MWCLIFQNWDSRISWRCLSLSALPCGTQNHRLLLKIVSAVCNTSVLLCNYTTKFPPCPCTPGFCSKAAPLSLFIFVRMSCPVRHLFSRIFRALHFSTRLLTPSAPCCCLGSLGCALNPLPPPTVALTLHLSSLNLSTYPSPKAGLLQSFF